MKIYSIEVEVAHVTFQSILRIYCNLELDNDMEI